MTTNHRYCPSTRRDHCLVCGRQRPHPIHREPRHDFVRGAVDRICEMCGHDDTNPLHS